MATMATVQTNMLFRMRADLDNEEKGICARDGIAPDQVLWLVGSRRSSLGGYLGNFEGTYQTYQNIKDVYSPNGKCYKNMPMSFFENV